VLYKKKYYMIGHGFGVILEGWFKRPTNPSPLSLSIFSTYLPCPSICLPSPALEQGYAAIAVHVLYCSASGHVPLLTKKG
jgi:hypothetical protein